MKRARVLAIVAISTLSAPVIDVGAGGAASATHPPTSPAASSGDGREVDDLQQAEVTAGDVREADRTRIAAAAPGPQTYLIRLADPAVPSYRGDKPGLAPTVAAAGGKLDTNSSAVRAYKGHLVQEQTGLVQRMERTVGHPIDVKFTYQYAVNGIAAVLTKEEALAIAADPGVVSVAPDKEREIQTDVGPQWEGAAALWNASTELGLPSDIHGEGIIIGTIDTGISPGSSSFADVGDDGYNHTNPLGAGNYLGVCDPTPIAGQVYDPLFHCNDKLIGAYVFGAINPTAVDYDEHGTHTSSTSGGNVVNDVTVEAPTITTPTFDISGVAPHANIVSYLGCCSTSGLTAAINQAIADQVDVINYSIGSSSPSELWDDFDTLGFLSAREAGIFVATSNGNDGPLPSTTGSPADAPWLTSVGASTHNRNNGNALTDLTSTGNGTLPDIVGKGVTGPLATATAIVYAGAAGIDDPQCLTTSGHTADFTGKIVICDRGINGRIEKSENVAAQGAVGFVLTNDTLNGDSLLGDEYALPGVFITSDDAIALKTWLSAGTGHSGKIAGTTFTVDDAYGDIMASFSSRGPNRAVDVIVPSVTAPGVDVLAALAHDSYTADTYGFISGTSMASPHVAGAAALLTQARPDWTPAQMQSALMTTARTTVLDFDGTPATPYEEGSGHVDVGRAALAGLVFDETGAHYDAANPDEGGDPKTLNTASFANSQCLSVCEWERVATVPDDSDAPVPDNVTWTASFTADPGLDIDVQLSPATVSPGDAMTISVSADVNGAPFDTTLFGRITLTPSDVDVPSVTLPVAVVPASGVLPDSVDIETRRNSGSQLEPDIQSSELTGFTASVLGMVKATQTEGFLAEDPTHADPYDDLSQVDVHVVDVPADSNRLAVEVLEAEMPDLDLYVGTGSTPSLATEVCASATGSALEDCDVADPIAGQYWVLIQNWEDSGDVVDPLDRYLLATGVVPGTDLNNAGIAGPSGGVPAGDPYDVTVHWNLPNAEAGDIWYGTGVLGTSPTTPGDIGYFPIRLHRAEDDVNKTASVDTVKAGDTIDYQIAVEPNITDTDLHYNIVDTVPAGLTIDPASVTAGGVINGQTITWDLTMPSAVGVIGDYVTSTPASSQQCANWAGFIDLADESIPLDPSLDGDTDAGSAFSSIGPFELYGDESPNLTVAEDGIVTLAGGYDGDPWIPQAIPDPPAPNGVFAPLWSDLELALGSGRGMRLATVSSLGAAVVQWDGAFEYTSDNTVGPSVGDFEAWIYNSVSADRPEMTFEYGALGALPSEATIGVEDLAGLNATAALSAGDPATVLDDNSTICLDYVAPVFDPAVLEYRVTVGAGSQPGTITNSAVHVTDDPYAEPVTASDSVDFKVVTAAIIPADGQGDPIKDNPVVFDVDFSEPVTGYDVSDIDLDGSADLSAASVAVSGSGSAYHVSVDGVAGAGTVALSVAAGAVTAIAAPNAPNAAASGQAEVDFIPALVPLPPTRIFDSRPDQPQGAVTIVKQRYGLDKILKVKFAGVAGVPESGAAAVAINLTIVDPAQPGYFVAYPCGTPPNSSSVNFAAGQTVANAVVVPLSADGEVCFYGSIDAHILADINGEFPQAAGLTSLTPTRVFDTRPSEPQGAVTVTKQKYGPGTTLKVKFTGAGGVPATGAEAVSINFTVVDPVAPGFATAFPCGTLPLASNLNFVTGQTVANAVIAPLSNSGEVCFYSSQDAHLIADVSGWFAKDSGLTSLIPTRVLDTRPNQPQGAVPVTQKKYGDPDVLEITIAGAAGVPASGVGLVSLNVTAVDPVGSGFITVYPCGPRPLASSVNYVTGQTVANAVLAPVSADGKVCFYSQLNTHLVVDVSGWFEG